MHINSANPTVTTASTDFVKAADGAGGWEGQRWDKAIEVPVTTLDALIAQHGRPDFVKIDVEGFEADVLAGLSQPLPALSFELTTIRYRCNNLVAGSNTNRAHTRVVARIGERDDQMGAIESHSECAVFTCEVGWNQGGHIVLKRTIIEVDELHT